MVEPRKQKVSPAALKIQRSMAAYIEIFTYFSKYELLIR